MVGEPSAWRANDVVAYDSLRETANAAIAILLRLSTTGAMSETESLSAAREIRQGVLGVDGFDRAQVDWQRALLDERLAELTSRLQ
ncbi:hypothetical protein ASF40_20490 [Microbacterium sp. Leaf288]|nr:hypothetical protein ASF40_20490 [Microbacterium sp. Leaf288]